MRAVRVIPIALLTALMALPALAQDRRPIDPAEPARRAADGQKRLEAQGAAGQIVLRGIARHGGLEAWFAGRALSFNYRYASTDGRPAIASDQTIDLLASRAYHTITEPGAGQFAWNGERAWVEITKEGFWAPPRFWSLTPYYFVGMPFVLGDPGVNLEVVDDDPAAAELPAADVVKITYDAGTGDAPDDYYVCYFAKDDGRLLALRYVVSYKPIVSKRGIKHTPEKLLVYSDYAEVGGLTLARTQTFYAFKGGKKGPKVTDVKVGELAFPATFDEARLDMPGGAKISPM